jgi:uncharacterized membrane protein YfcA
VTRTAGLGLGLAAGFLSSYFGIGGGILVVPALALLLALPIKRCVGTSLAVMVPVALAGAAAEATFDLATTGGARFAARPIAFLAIAPAAVLAAWTGRHVVRRAPPTALRVAFGLLLILAGLRLAGLDFHTASPWLYAAGGAPLLALPLLGLCAGLLSVLFGIGGGILIVPALQALFADRTFVEARATSLLVIIPTSLAGLAGHVRLGTIERPTALALIPPAILGALLGVLAAKASPETTSRLLFGILLCFAGARMLATSRQEAAGEAPLQSPPSSRVP